MSAERLRAALSYDKETGLFYWAESKGRAARVGSVAGSVGPQGYVLIRLDGTQYRAHRLAWMHVTGQWPSDQIDHVNGVRSDNRFVNLREASNAENQQNTCRKKPCLSGEVGIDWCKKSRKWRARIRFRGKLIHIGLFNEIESAISARAEAKKDLHTFSPTQR